VLADIANRGAEKIICLGDVLGYGPQPKECLDLVRGNAAVTLMGNHDFAVLFEPAKFNVGAEAACYWTRRQLEEEPDVDLRNTRWDFLGNLELKHSLSGEPYGMGELMFSHGSPRRPINEYIFPDDIYNSPGKFQGIFDRFPHLCFVGHTHVPGVFTEAPDYYSPEELEGVYDVDPARKALVNVGSVGQPRDRDNRACYVLVEPGAIRFVRVEYDVEAVVKEVQAIGELDEFLGTRLKDGR